MPAERAQWLSAVLTGHTRAMPGQLAAAQLCPGPTGRRVIAERPMLWCAGHTPGYSTRDRHVRWVMLYQNCSRRAGEMGSVQGAMVVKPGENPQ